MGSLVDTEVATTPKSHTFVLGMVLYNVKLVNLESVWLHEMHEIC